MDLPDPLESPPAPPGPAGADDLLSRMAGEEIDRLLAEADVDRDPPVAETEPLKAAAEPAGRVAPAAEIPRPVTAATRLAAASPEDPAMAAEMDEVFEESTRTAGIVVTPAERRAPAEPAPDAGVKDLLQQLSAADAAAEEASRETVSQPAGPVPPAEAEPHPDAQSPADAEGATSAAERAGLDRPSVEGETSSPESASQDESPPRTPLLVRVLEWVNAPMNALPDRARDAVGAVAIGTFIMAAAVLVYVLLFRK